MYIYTHTNTNPGLHTAQGRSATAGHVANAVAGNVQDLQRSLKVRGLP